jgi:hypothetical protein
LEAAVEKAVVRSQESAETRTADLGLRSVLRPLTQERRLKNSGLRTGNRKLRTAS